MAAFWGMFAYSVIVLGLVTGLAIKLGLMFRDREVLRSELKGAERRVKDATAAAEGSQKMVVRYRKEIGVLQDELDQADSDLGNDGVADRLKRLLSGEMSKDNSENGEGGSAVSASGGSDDKTGDV